MFRTFATQFCRSRLYSTSTPEIRDALLARVKVAMKAKDTSTSTTLRSVLAEINAADKTSESKISSSSVITILRKAAARRQEAAAQYTQASRPDLAEKELREAELLSEFVPPLLSTADIDSNIRDALAALGLSPPVNDRKLLGQIFKQFYSKVDRSLVDTEVVKKRVESILIN